MKELNNKIMNILFIIIKLMLIFLIGLAVINIFFFRDNLQTALNYKIIVAFGVIYACIIVGMIYLNKKIKINISDRFKKYFKFIFAIVIFILQIIYAICILRGVGFDYNVIYYSAVDLMHGMPPSMEYFSMYTNNIFLLLVKEIIFSISNVFKIKAFFTVDVIFNIIIIDIAIIYLYKLCNKLFGKEYGWLSYLFSIPMLGFTPYIIVPYSDTLSLIFPILIFYNYILYKESNGRIKYIGIITLFSILGVYLKPTNIIILIAILLIEGFKCILNIFNKNREKINRKMLLKHCKSISVVLFILVFITCGYKIYRKSKIGMYINDEMIENNSFPMTHFMMMGLKPTDVEGTYYGYYLLSDVENTQSHIGVDAKIEYNISEIKARLEKMGVKGYMKFIYDKFTVIISDGSFFYGEEGHFFIDEPYYNFSLAKKIQSYIYLEGENYYVVTIQIMQAYWTFVLILILISSFISLFKKDSDSNNILRTSIIGIILFILLFEGRSRYLINYLPVFIALAVSGIIGVYKIFFKDNIKMIE